MSGWSIHLWNFWCCCLVAFNLTFSFLGLDSLDEAFLSGISDSVVLLLFYSFWEVGASLKTYSRLCTDLRGWTSWWKAVLKNSDDEEIWGFIRCSGSCFKVKFQCNLREAYLDDRTFVIIIIFFLRKIVWMKHSFLEFLICCLVAFNLTFSFLGRWSGWSIPFWNFWFCCLVAFLFSLRGWGLVKIIQ